jgi:hypothetical protein
MERKNRQPMRGATREVARRRRKSRWATKDMAGDGGIRDVRRRVLCALVGNTRKTSRPESQAASSLHRLDIQTAHFWTFCHCTEDESEKASLGESLVHEWRSLKSPRRHRHHHCLLPAAIIHRAQLEIMDKFAVM